MMFQKQIPSQDTAWPHDMDFSTLDFGEEIVNTTILEIPKTKTKQRDVFVKDGAIAPVSFRTQLESPESVLLARVGASAHNAQVALHGYSVASTRVLHYRYDCHVVLATGALLWPLPVCNAEAHTNESLHMLFKERFKLSLNPFRSWRKCEHHSPGNRAVPGSVRACAPKCIAQECMSSYRYVMWVLNHYRHPCHGLWRDAEDICIT